MSKIYAGEIIEMRMSEYENPTTSDMESILNVIVATTKKLAGSINVTVNRTVVLFKAVADKVHADFKAGDFIIFNEVERNARSYTTPRGTLVETVDINLLRTGTVSSVTKTAYNKNLNILTPMMLPADDLEFTDEDRVALGAIAESAEENGSADGSNAGTDVDPLMA